MSTTITWRCITIWVATRDPFNENEWYPDDEPTAYNIELLDIEVDLEEVASYNEEDNENDVIKEEDDNISYKIVGNGGGAEHAPHTNDKIIDMPEPLMNDDEDILDEIEVPLSLPQGDPELVYRILTQHKKRNRRKGLMSV